MTASELIKLIRRLHQPGREAERLDFYRSLQNYRVETGYDWEEHMNDPSEQGIIMSGVYLAWAQDRAEGLHFWDTTGSRYLLPLAFTWDKD